MTEHAIDTKLWNLQDMIRGLGFTATSPRYPGPYREDWHTKQIHGGTHLVRVIIHPDDGYRVEAHYLDRHGVPEWGVTFSGGTPHKVIRAALKAMTG